MIAYLDTSILLRVLLNQKAQLKEFNKIERPVSSKLLKAECLRTLDRFKVSGHLNENDYVRAMEQAYDGIDSVELIEISDPILDRIGMGLSFPLGTLDAIHLVSAIYWREQTSITPTFLTHDLMLAQAARVSGFPVLGC